MTRVPSSAIARTSTRYSKQGITPRSILVCVHQLSYNNRVHSGGLLAANLRWAWPSTPDPSLPLSRARDFTGDALPKRGHAPRRRDRDAGIQALLFGYEVLRSLHGGHDRFRGMHGKLKNFPVCRFFGSLLKYCCTPFRGNPFGGFHIYTPAQVRV